MADGRSKSLWSHTSEILALIANVNRDPKKHPEPFKAADINPHARERPKAPRKTVSMTELRTMVPELPAAMAGSRRMKIDRG